MGSIWTACKLATTKGLQETPKPKIDELLRTHLLQPARGQLHDLHGGLLLQSLPLLVPVVELRYGVPRGGQCAGRQCGLERKARPARLALGAIVILRVHGRITARR